MCFRNFFSKKEVAQAEKPTEEPNEPPQPKPHDVIMGIVLLNNRTDKEYPLRSKNDFGLTWKYTDPNNLTIRQKNSKNDDCWDAIAIVNLREFSVIRIDWEEKLL